MADENLVATELQENEAMDDIEVVARFQYEIEARVDDFLDEESILHNVYPDSESDRETDKGKKHCKGSKYDERDHYQSRRGDEILHEGQVFYNGVEFKDCVLAYALESGRNIRQYRYDKTKLGYECAMGDECKWRVYCSVVGKSDKWQIKVFKQIHTCIPNGDCEMLKVPVIARLFLDQIRDEPEYMMPMKIEEIIKERWKITVSRPQCQSARLTALKWIEKEYAEQFAHLRDYGTEILDSNPGSTVAIETILNEAGEDVFSRFYVCFDALRRAWKHTCRRLLGVDGCFIKTRMKGQLLVAIGRDGDNKIYPIAWTVVQVENNENWNWFVGKVKDDLGLSDGEGYIIVSDRQKGLIKAVETELPKIEHRMCVRHIYGNLKSRHRKKPHMKLLVWNLAWSYNESDFQANLDRIKCYDSAVYDDVMKSKPHTWCRAFHKIGNCCEDVENNSTESFNNTLGKAREKPFVPMLETIRRLAMVRISKRSSIACKHMGICTPYATKFIESEHEKAAECKVYRSTHGMFEVILSGCGYRVSLERRTCTCRKWELTGIPCEHAYAVIMDKKGEVSEYVADWFHTTTWRNNYAQSITPLRGARFWLCEDTPLVVEPPAPPQPGRKKKTSKKEKKRKKVAEFNGTRSSQV